MQQVAGKLPKGTSQRQNAAFKTQHNEYLYIIRSLRQRKNIDLLRRLYAVPKLLTYGKHTVDDRSTSGSFRTQLTNYRPKCIWWN